MTLIFGLSEPVILIILMTINKVSLIIYLIHCSHVGTFITPYIAK